MNETIIVRFLHEFWNLITEMSVYLLLGFFLAGILNVLISKRFVQRHLGDSGFWASFKASALGVPLPLCSCGVIPTAISFYQQGASKPSTISFLISTPQTGIDSILITGVFIGWPFAIFRALVAFFSGIAGGWITSLFHGKKTSGHPETKLSNEASKNLTLWDKIRQVFSYAFGEFMYGLSHYLLLGLILAAIIAVIVPDNYFETISGNRFVVYFLVLVASIPLYICATSSVPMAAVLLLKGLSPGAVLIFLMAGPATNMATITVLFKTLGRYATFAYLTTITGFSIAFAFIIDSFSWIQLTPLHTHAHQHHFFPDSITLIASVVLFGLILYHISRRGIYWYQRHFINKTLPMSSSKIYQVEGMNCNHCKMRMEKAISSIEGVEAVIADPEKNTLQVTGENFDDRLIKQKVEELGYKFIQ
ncbi:MAG TPA: permease [Salinivirgaceae bacterium]|nr:permease [Salinivirgaceae bacterium]